MHYGFLRIPGQFWPVFQKADYDPGVAMTNFLGAIGCNPELVRHGDRREQQKAREVIELLVRSTWVLQRIRSERKRSEIGRFLQSGDYVRVRELAEALTHIAAALGMASNWSKEKVIAACESRARELARYLRNPPMTATEVAGLREEIAQLVVQQSRFDDLLRHYDGVRKAIEAGWPADWMPESPLWREKSRLYREVGAIVGDLSSAEGLRPKQVAERLDHLAEIVAGLDRLAAEAAGYGSTGAPKPLQRQVDHQVEATAALLEEALGSFGFSRQNPPDSLETLKREWLRRTDELQPDRYMTAPDEVYTKANEEYLRLMAGFEHLVSYFGWTRPAEA
jgi:hypothetical protein